MGKNEKRGGISVQILLTNIDGGAESIDATDRLDQGAETINDAVASLIGQKLERQAFERSVEDTHLRMDNMDNFFTDLFRETLPDNRWDIEIYSDTRRLFGGSINLHGSTVFKQKSEFVEFDVFSWNRQFWDIAALTRIWKYGPTVAPEIRAPITKPWNEVLALQVTASAFNDLFIGYTIDPLYVGRPIRWYGYQLGNNRGRFVDLDPRTTIKQLLTAAARYYNAEFFIDSETRNLVMRKRGAILRDIKHSVSANLRDDKEPEITLFDEEQIDYLGMHLNLAAPNPPSVVTILAVTPSGEPHQTYPRGLYAGAYKWKLTYVFETGGLRLETSPSESVSLTLNLIVDQHGQKVYHVEFALALPPANVTERRLYRTKNDGSDGFFLVATVTDPSERTVNDFLADEYLGKASPPEGLLGNVWLRYDEATGKWDAPIFEDPHGLNRPNGEIFEVTPELSFLETEFGDVLTIAHSRKFPAGNVLQLEFRDPHSLKPNEYIEIRNHSIAAINGIRKVLTDKGITAGDLPRIHFQAVLCDGYFDPTAVGDGGEAIRMHSPFTDQWALNIKSRNILDVFAFFGNETNLELFQQQWIDMFLSKRGAILPMTGIDYRVGDSVVWEAKGHKMVVKSADVNITREETDLVAITEPYRQGVGIL